MTTLKDLAEDLEATANCYSNENVYVDSLLTSIRDLLEIAKTGGEIPASTTIPGSRLFSDGPLSKYTDLEDSYSKFCIFIAAGSEEEYKKMLQIISKL